MTLTFLLNCLLLMQPIITFVFCFKVNLEYFKKDCMKKGNYCDKHHWKVSDEVISRIEGDKYLKNKNKHNTYLWFHPFVAKKKFINLN